MQQNHFIKIFAVSLKISDQVEIFIIFLSLNSLSFLSQFSEILASFFTPSPFACANNGKHFFAFFSLRRSCCVWNIFPYLMLLLLIIETEAPPFLHLEKWERKILVFVIKFYFYFFHVFRNIFDVSKLGFENGYERLCRWKLRWSYDKRLNIWSQVLMMKS